MLSPVPPLLPPSGILALPDRDHLRRVVPDPDQVGYDIPPDFLHAEYEEGPQTETEY